MSTIPLADLGSSRPLHDHSPLSPPHDIEDVFPEASHTQDEAISTSAAKAPQWKRDLYALLEHPTSSPSAFVVHVFTTGLIVLSSLVTILETVPAFHEISGGTWFGLETTLVALFTVEYIARCVARSLSWKILFSWVWCACHVIWTEGVLTMLQSILRHH
jgi:potassium voltage-gated channel Shal-related subfamily D protein 2